MTRPQLRNTVEKPRLSGAKTRKQNAQRSITKRVNLHLGLDMPKNNPHYPNIRLQLDSREISQEQLAAEVKSIYSGLSMVEAKCIHVDNAQAAAFNGAEKGGSPLAEDHWQALIALHRTLLHEHHDFFLASQHPSASQALKRLAAKYSMPARMWKHGIHSFLELLRCRLPSSREYMRTFIYFAYHMMALLFETVPSFEDTWIECLGDLGRYRMAIEDDDARERDIWAGISQYWYRMAADRVPEVGRLYHHLAILARSEPFQQIYYYCRSFTCSQLFPSARESVLAVFDPIFNRSHTSTQIPRIDTSYTKLHGMIFLNRQLEDFRPVMSNFLRLLDNHIIHSGIKWREHGAWLAISNIGALFEHGNNNSVLRQLFKKEPAVHLRRESDTSNKPDNIETENLSGRHSPAPSSSTDATVPEPDPSSKRAFNCSLDLTMHTYKIVLQRRYDKNVLAHVHILLAFLVTLADFHPLRVPIQHQYVHNILNRVPWQELCSYTSTLANSEEFGSRFKTTSFLEPERGDVGPLPEDYLLRGQIWAEAYFPKDWFQDDEIDAEEKSIEHASTVRRRAERVLSLMYRLASQNKWVRYDDTRNSWFPTASSPQVAIPAGRGLRIVTTTEDVDMDTPSDIEAPDATDPESPLSEDDSKEMRILKAVSRRKARRRSTQPQSHSLQVPSPKDMSSGKAAAAEIMREGYTVTPPFLHSVEQLLISLIENDLWRRSASQSTRSLQLDH